MAIAPEALAAFLERDAPNTTRYKGVSREVLLGRIEKATGAPLSTKTEPRPYQLEGLAFALVHHSALLFYDMRLGKTKMSLDWASHLKRVGWVHEKGLVVAHAPIGIDVWEGQIPQHSDLEARYVRSGPAAAEHLLDAVESDCDLVVSTS